MCWKDKRPTRGKYCPDEICCQSRCVKVWSLAALSQGWSSSSHCLRYSPDSQRSEPCPSRKDWVLAGDLAWKRDTFKALLFSAFYVIRRSCGDSKDMRLSQVCNILCTVCYARLFIHGCTTRFYSECWMSSPKNSVWVVGLLWCFLPLKKSPCTDFVISSLTTLAFSTLILYIVLFSGKRLISFHCLVCTVS